MKNSYSKAFRATLKGTTLATSRCTRQFSFKRHTLVVWGLLVRLWGYAKYQITTNTVWDANNPPLPEMYSQGIEIILDGSLTIDGLNLDFNYDKSIVIKHGSLKVINSTLTFERSNAKIEIRDDFSNPLVRNLTCINSTLKAHGIDGKWYETKQTVSLLQ